MAKHVPRRACRRNWASAADAFFNSNAAQSIQHMVSHLAYDPSQRPREKRRFRPKKLSQKRKRCKRVCPVRKPAPNLRHQLQPLANGKKSVTEKIHYLVEKRTAHNNIDVAGSIPRTQTSPNLHRQLPCAPRNQPCIRPQPAMCHVFPYANHQENGLDKASRNTAR